MIDLEKVVREAKCKYQGHPLDQHFSPTLFEEDLAIARAVHRATLEWVVENDPNCSWKMLLAEIDKLDLGCTDAAS